MLNIDKKNMKHEEEQMFTFFHFRKCQRCSLSLLQSFISVTSTLSKTIQTDIWLLIAKLSIISNWKLVSASWREKASFGSRYFEMNLKENAR